MQDILSGFWFIANVLKDDVKDHVQRVLHPPTSCAYKNTWIRFLCTMVKIKTTSKCEFAAVPGIIFGVLLRVISLGLLNFWETVLRYFLKGIPPPPLCGGSVEETPGSLAAADDELAGVELAAPVLEVDRASRTVRDPGGSDMVLLNGFLLEPPPLLSVLPPSPPFPLEGFLSPGSSLRALRQFCILFHLLAEAFWNLLMVDVEEAASPCPSPFASSRVPLEPVCHL